MLGRCVLFASVGWVAGCSLFTSLSDLNSGDGGTDSGFSDASACARGSMVLSVDRSFCIDATEVTKAQYDAFLTAKAGDVSGQPARCAFNMVTGGFAQAGQPIDGCPVAELDPSAPKVCLDVCDAYGYCAWAGKRLCGLRGGGAVQSPKTTSSFLTAEWYLACSHNADGVHAYPYGNTYDPKACNGADYEAGAPLGAGVLASCSDGVGGARDLSGNVQELIDGDGFSGALELEYFLGGGYRSPSASLTCAWVDSDFQERGLPDVGFRCCASP